jgi:CRP-like cAMP-binding protein
MNPSAEVAPNLDKFTGFLDKPDSVRPEEGNTAAPSLYTIIEKQPFFRGLSAHQLRLLTDSALETRFDPGQTIFAEGSPANRFYLILTGKVVLGSEQADHNIIPIQTLGPGDDLGWSWLFPPYSLHLSARAVEPTRTVFFYGPRLREQCERDHEFGYQLMKRIAEVTTQCLQATQLRLSENVVRNRWGTL